MLEKDIEKQILHYLDMLPECFCWKNPTIGVWDSTKKVYRKPKSKYHIRGASDIIGIYKGKFLAIEVKSAKGRTSKQQEDFIDMINCAGGLAFVARSVEDVVEGLKVIK